MRSGLVLAGLLACLSVSSASALGTGEGGGTCERKPGEAESCVPVGGCVGSDGIVFGGQAIGWGRGTFIVHTNTGRVCKGTWQTEPPPSKTGTAQFLCDDQISGQVSFTRFEGPATGPELMERGNSFALWVGDQLRQFVNSETGAIDMRLMCGDAPVPSG